MLTITACDHVVVDRAAVHNERTCIVNATAVTAVCIVITQVAADATAVHHHETVLVIKTASVGHTRQSERDGCIVIDSCVVLNGQNARADHIYTRALCIGLLGLDNGIFDDCRGARKGNGACHVQTRTAIILGTRNVALHLTAAHGKCSTLNSNTAALISDVARNGASRNGKCSRRHVNTAAVGRGVARNGASRDGKCGFLEVDTSTVITLGSIVRNHGVIPNGNGLAVAREVQSAAAHLGRRVVTDLNAADIGVARKKHTAAADRRIARDLTARHGNGRGSRSVYAAATNVGIILHRGVVVDRTACHSENRARQIESASATLCGITRNFSSRQSDRNGSGVCDRTARAARRLTALDHAARQNKRALGIEVDRAAVIRLEVFDGSPLANLCVSCTDRRTRLTDSTAVRGGVSKVCAVQRNVGQNDARAVCVYGKHREARDRTRDRIDLGTLLGVILLTCNGDRCLHRNRFRCARQGDVVRQVDHVTLCRACDRALKVLHRSDLVTCRRRGCRKCEAEDEHHGKHHHKRDQSCRVVFFHDFFPFS